MPMESLVIVVVGWLTAMTLIAAWGITVIREESREWRKATKPDAIRDFAAGLRDRG
jgi:hypothetical protein